MTFLKDKRQESENEKSMHEIHSNRCCWLYLQLAEWRVVGCAPEAVNGWVTGLDPFKGRPVWAEPPITVKQIVERTMFRLGQEAIIFNKH